MRSDNNYDTGSLYIEKDGTWRIIGPTEPGPQPYNPGGEVAMWESKDQGSTWEKVKQLTRNSKFNHTYVRSALNPAPEFYAFWADGHGREQSDSSIYFCDKSGNVRLLPREMNSNTAKPKTIKQKSRSKEMIRQKSNWKTGLKLAVTGVLLLAGATHYAQNNMSVLRVQNGKLYKDGKEYRGFGLNASYLSDKVLNVGKDAKESFKAIEYLGKKKIPYVRTWLGYLGNWKPYFNDEKKYWENMDLLVDAFEKANVGLIPTLFWKHEYIPWEFNESQKDMMNPDSKGRKFMAEYTKKFINRYKDRKIIWMWEWSNESNYAWNLPHERKKKNQNDVLTHELGMTISKAFAEEVRQLDPYRPISTGNGSVREDFYNRAMNLRNLWKKDTLAEQLIAAKWCAPDPYDTLSIHRYMYWQDNKCDMKPFIETVDRHMALAKKTKKTFVYRRIWTAHVLCVDTCLLYTSPSPRDLSTSRMPSSA
eukprot:TRINITY_DN4910_c0_g1_i2.p1 TRINITY_DN4910_c0_g1~~TRINITY_DN4910_c0_g1_i2.p1  ORF type:complete len:477 (+),score=85.86 TRINITY_DN4910_c0_g1_i2:242-1672(+)